MDTLSSLSSFWVVVCFTFLCLPNHKMHIKKWACFTTSVRGMAWLAGNVVWGDSLKCDVKCIVLCQHGSNLWEWKMNTSVIATSNWEDCHFIITCKGKFEAVTSSLLFAQLRKTSCTKHSVWTKVRHVSYPGFVQIESSSSLFILEFMLQSTRLPRSHPAPPTQITMHCSDYCADHCPPINCKSLHISTDAFTCGIVPLKG